MAKKPHTWRPPGPPIPIGFKSQEMEMHFCGARRHLHIIRRERAEERARQLAQHPLAGYLKCREVAAMFGISTTAAWECKQRWRCHRNGKVYRRRR